MRSLILPVSLLLLISCGTTETAPDTGHLVYTGTVQVLAQGSRSETVILEDLETGEFYALVGETARELVRHAGSMVTVTSIVTDEGWSVRPDLVKLKVIEYVMETELEYTRSQEY